MAFEKPPHCGCAVGTRAEPTSAHAAPRAHHRHPHHALSRAPYSSAFFVWLCTPPTPRCPSRSRSLSLIRHAPRDATAARHAPRPRFSCPRHARHGPDAHSP
jgi:hypothetical protein